MVPHIQRDLFKLLLLCGLKMLQTRKYNSFKFFLSVFLGPASSSFFFKKKKTWPRF